MKKIFFAIVSLITSIVVFAQDNNTTNDDKAYNAGYWIGKNIIWIILGIVVLIVVIRLVRKKNNTPPPPPPPAPKA